MVLASKNLFVVLSNYRELAVMLASYGELAIEFDKVNLLCLIFNKLWLFNMMLNILVNLLCCYQNVGCSCLPTGLMPFIDGYLEAPFGNPSLSETVDGRHQPYWLTLASMQPSTKGINPIG